jgi:hypothetical protein
LDDIVHRGYTEQFFRLENHWQSPHIVLCHPTSSSFNRHFRVSKDHLALQTILEIGIVRWKQVKINYPLKIINYRHTGPLKIIHIHKFLGRFFKADPFPNQFSRG